MEVRVLDRDSHHEPSHEYKIGILWISLIITTCYHNHDISTLMKLVATVLAGSTPSMGKRTTGRRAVTGREIASVTQYTAMTTMP